MLVSIYNVSRKSWPTFRDRWPRNGWDRFAYCDPPFGGHYIATVKVAICLVMAAEGEAMIFYRCSNIDVFFLFYFVSIGKRPAMESQPNLACRSEVVSIYKCPQIFRAGSPLNFGVQKHQILDTFWRLPHSTLHISATICDIDKQKMLISICNVSP